MCTLGDFVEAWDIPSPIISMSYRSMLRKRIFVVTSAYFLLLAGLAIMLYRASPAPSSQDILGLGIGSYTGENGIAYISGRHLLCTTTPASDSFTSACRIQIAGKTLEIHARQAERKPLGGVCEVFYDGQQWPCTIGSRHVHVYRFAYIEPPLGLGKSQLDVLRFQYFFENLPERVYFPAGVLIVSVTTTLVVITSTVTVLWSRRYKALFSIVFLALVGMVTFACTFFGGIWLTTGFWD